MAIVAVQHLKGNESYRVGERVVESLAGLDGEALKHLVEPALLTDEVGVAEHVAEGHLLDQLLGGWRIKAGEEDCKTGIKPN